MYEAKGLLEDIAEAFGEFLAPLRVVADDPRGLYVLLSRFNWRLEGLLGSNLAPLRAGLELAVQAAQAAREACDRPSETAAVLELGPALMAAFESIKGMRSGLCDSASMTLGAEMLEDLGRDLAESLLLAYLAKRSPELFEIARILGLIVLSAPPALARVVDGNQDMLRFPVRRPTLRYGILDVLRSDPMAALLRSIDLAGPALATDAAGFLGSGIDSLWNAFRRIGEMCGDSLEGASATLDLSGITLKSPRLAFSEGGPVAVPFPMDDPPSVAFRDGALRLLWQPATLPGPEAGLTLFEEHGFRISVPEVAAEMCPARGLTLAYAGGEVSLKLHGGLRVELPLAAAAAEATEETIGATVCASLERSGDGDPRLTLDLLRIGPLRVRLGGKDGILIEDAGFELAGLAFTRTAVDPALMRLKALGTLSLGDGALKAQFTAEYASDSRRFTLACTGSVQLGDGLKLESIDEETPVFSLAAVPGEQTVEIQGRLRLPGSAGIEGVRASGQMRLSVEPGRMPRVLAFSATCEMEGDWDLPGGITLESASAEISFDGTRFSATLAGAARLTGSDVLSGDAACTLIISGNPDDPEDLRLDGSVEHVSLRFTDQTSVFDATLGLKLRTKPEPGDPIAELTISEASGGLFLRESAAAPGGPGDFHLGLEAFSGKLIAAPGEASLSVDSGVLLLPFAFSDAAAPAQRPRLNLASADHPLKFAYTAPDTVAFQGRVTLLDVGVRFPEDNPEADFRAHIATATLDFSSASLPVLSEAAGFVTFPLPDGETARLDFSGVGWDLLGFPVGTLSLGSDIGIELGGGFRVSLLQANPSASADAGGTGLTVSRIHPSKHARLRIRAAVRLTLPEAVLCDVAGGTVSLEAAGSLTFATDGTQPEADISALGAGGEFWLGGAETGLRLTGTEAEPDGAQVRASGISHLFRRSLDEAHTFTIALDGAVEFPDGGPRLELQGARLAFLSDDTAVPPKFKAEGFAFTPGERLVESLPITLTKAGIRFFNPNLEIPALFGVDSQGTSNLEIALGASMEFPMGEKSIMARVDDVRVALVHGVPRLSLGGIGFLVEDITVGNMAFSGGVYLGGLQGLFRNPPDPSGVFAAGKLGGSVSGTGISGLAAFKLAPPMPLGVSLGLEAGSVGIPLGQTGILFTGASGGISFANSNKSPGDLGTYISLDSDGKPKAIPPDPSGRPMAIPPPDDRPVNAPRKSDKPVEAPGCPCDCPPASMNVFCQPHPDQEQFPGRVILKFSSLTEEFLEGLSIPFPSPSGTVSMRSLRDFVLGLPQPLPADLPADLDSLAATLGDVLGNGIREAAFSLWPGGPAQVPAKLQAMLAATQAAFTARLRESLAGLGTRSLWRLVCDEAYKGLPCPDVTQEITATFSYAGISSFLSITGGVSVSTTGAAGVVGWLNLVGIKVGRLSGFLTVTSPTGEIDPALCGQLLCSVGPLELGSVNAALSCRGFLTGLREAVVASAVGIGKPVAQRVLAEVAPALASDPLFQSEPETLLSRLTTEQITIYAGALSRIFQDAGMAGAASLDLAALRAVFTAMLQNIWSRFEPELVLCGKVGPKLFGMQLGSDLVSVKAWAGKQEMGASFAFSPLVLVTGSILGSAAAALFCGFEQATLGFTLQFPDPVQMLLDGIGGAFRGPADVEAYAARGLEAILRHSSIVASYRLSPFGMKLVNAGARVVLPDLVNHPAFRDPAHPWLRPPDRLELLGKILAAGKLDDSLWDGNLGGIDPGYGGLWLGSDYFPHGGMIGAARLVLPRALTDTPDLETLRIIVQDGEPMPRLQAALKYLKEYVLRMEEAGTFAFYAPAPNPPGLAFRGKPLTGEDLLRTLTDSGFAREVASEQTTPINPDTSAEAFLLGKLNVRLLGIPLGDALMEFTPGSGGVDGRLLVSAKAPPESWPLRLGLDARFSFSVTKKPSLPMDIWFGILAEALGMPAEGASDTSGPSRSAADEARAAIAAVPRTASDVEALVARLRDVLIADAERMAARARAGEPPDFYPRSQAAEAAEQAGLAEKLEPDLERISERLVNLAGQVRDARLPGSSESEQTAAVAGALARRLAAMISEDLPKVALEAHFRFRIPTELAAFLKSAGGTAFGEAKARLHAYSPGYDPSASGNARADAQRLGGVVMIAGLRFDIAFAGARLSFVLPDAEFSLTPPEAGDSAVTAFPRLRAMIDLPPIDVPLWGTKLSLKQAKFVFDSAAPDGLIAAVEGLLPAIRIGKFGIASASGGPVRARLEVRRESGGVVPSLWIEPSRLSLPMFSQSAGLALSLHGERPDHGARIDANGNLEAGLSAASDLCVQSPYDPTDPPLLRIQGSGIFGSLRKAQAGIARVSLEIDASCALTAFPGQAWERAFSSPGLDLTASSDGKFRLVLAIPAIQFSAFRLSGTDAPGDAAPINVRLTQYGFTLDAARLTIVGTGIPALALRRFVINGNGEMRASAKTGNLDLPGFLHVGSASLKLRRQAGQAYLLAEKPKVKLFPGTPMAASVNPGGTIRIDSSGAFSVSLHAGSGGTPALGVADAFTVEGELSFGYTPPSSGGTGPFVIVKDAVVRLPAFPGAPEMRTTHAAFTSEGATADLAVTPFGVPGLVEIGAFVWSLRYSLATRTLSLQSQTPSLTLFRIFACGGPDLNLVMSAQAASFHTGKLDLVAGFFEIGPGEWTLSGTVLTYRGAARILSRPLAGLTVRFSAATGGIRAALSQNIELAAVAGVLSASVPTETFLLKWVAAGAHSLSAHIQASLFGTAASATADIASDGRVTVSWTGSSPFKLGPFRLTTGVAEDSRIGFRPLNPTVPEITAHLGAGFLRVNSGFSVQGWPETGAWVDACDLDANGDFTASLPSLAFNGIDLISDEGENQIRLNRSQGKFALRIRQAVHFFGFGMTMTITVDETGKVEGDLAGRLKLDFGGGIGQIDFGEVVLGYHPDDEYPFWTRTPKVLWDFLLSWKPDGARACVVNGANTDGSLNLGPCL